MDLSRAVASHVSECPEIGPACDLGYLPPQMHHTALWLANLQLLAEYGLAPNLAFQAVLPLRLVDTRTQFTDLSGNDLGPDAASIHHRNETLVGLGDAQLLVHTARFFAGTSVGIRAGATVPLGFTVPNPYRLGEEGEQHEHLQFGTGTIDPLLGVDVARAVGAYQAGVFGFLRAPLLQNTWGYQAGTQLSGGASLARSFGISGPTLRLAVIGYHEFPERWNGVVPEEDGNQGRTDVYLSPGITLPFGTDWSASVDLRVRVYSHVVNAQLDMPVVFAVSIGRLLHLEDEGEHEDEHQAAAPPSNVEDHVLNGEARPLTGVPGKFVVYDFWAPWCDACRTVDAELRELAEQRTDVIIRRVNIVDFESAIARQELPGVDLLPHVRVLSPDGAVIAEQSGPADQIIELVRRSVR